MLIEPDRFLTCADRNVARGILCFDDGNKLVSDVKQKSSQCFGGFSSHQQPSTEDVHTSSLQQQLCASPLAALYFVSRLSTGSVPPMQSWMDGGTLFPCAYLTPAALQIHHCSTHTQTHVTPTSLNAFVLICSLPLSNSAIALSYTVASPWKRAN